MMQDNPPLDVVDGFSPLFLLPFGAAACSFTLLGTAASMPPFGAAVTASAVGLLVGCGATVRDGPCAIYAVAAGLWAVASAFFVLPFMAGDPSAGAAAWIAASDLGFAGMIAADMFGRTAGHGARGRLAASAVSAHAAFLAAVFLIASPIACAAYMALLAIHAHALARRFRPVSGPADR